MGISINQLTEQQKHDVFALLDLVSELKRRIAKRKAKAINQ